MSLYKQPGNKLEIKIQTVTEDKAISFIALNRRETRP
jgi:hypothetical protein